MHFDLKKFAAAVTQLAPILLPIAGVPPELTNLVTHGIVVAQHLPGADGPTKKAYVQDLVLTGAQGVNAAAGKVVVDPAQVSGAVSQGIDAVISAVELAHNIPVKSAAPPQS